MLTFTDVPQVEVVVREDGREIAAYEEDVALANKNGFGGGEFFDRLHGSEELGILFFAVILDTFFCAGESSQGQSRSP